MSVESQRKSIGWIFKTLFILAIVGTVAGTGIAGFLFWHFSHGLPKIITVDDYRPRVVTRILGEGGKDDALFAELYDVERRYLVPYDRIPDLVVKAFISAEDDRFFEHQGINLASILRAMIANFRAGHFVQGGSTITQQVAKSLLLTPEKSLLRKAKEVILANRIEKNLTKQQILYLYLNQIYLGRGAYGVQASAKTYYHKDVGNLTVGEAALLAGMPQAPGKYSPHLNPKRAKERQLYVLRRMYENKFISQVQMSEAAAQPLRIYYEDETSEKNAAYMVEHVRRYLIEKYGEDAVYHDGLTVSISASPQLSRIAHNSLQEGLRAVDKRGGFRGPIQHLNDVSDIEKFLKDQRIELIGKKIGYQLLLPDGRLDPIEAMHAAGISNDVQLLSAGELQRAVVTSLDNNRKTVGVMIGGAKLEINADRMKWAAAQLGVKPLIRGDVILVHIEKSASGQLVAALDQEPQVQGALFSIDAQTGMVLAMEGGYDHSQSEFNRAFQAQRQPGSAFKPILYTAALEKGYTPASVIVDSPIVYGDSENGKWKPSNFEEKFYGDTTFRQALIKSRNVPTIKIVQALQVPFVIDFSKRLGLNGQFNNDLSISLGSGAVSLVELTKAYAVFPRLGRKVVPTFILQVKDRDGKILEEYKPQANAVRAIPSTTPRAEELAVAAASGPGASPTPVVYASFPPANDPDQVLDPRLAYVMTHLMKEVVNFGTGHEAKSLGRSSAGKTGTTNDYIDAWYMGFTPNVVTGVWVGFDSQKTIGDKETGARAALPIWLNFMKEAVKPFPDVDFPIPPGVVFVSIDPVTGKRVSPNVSNSIKEAFVEGTEPIETVNASGRPAASTSDFFKEDID